MGVATFLRRLNPSKDPARFVLLSSLTDLQRLQCPIVDPVSDGQLFDGLEPANRSFGLWADQAIDRTVIITEFR
jgi:hypothetical protein